MEDVNFSVRLKGDKIILKLGDQTKELIVTNQITDEVTQLANLLLERRKEVLDKRRRDLLQEIRRDRKG